MSVIILDGRVVHYEAIGRGRPVVFLHGWVGSWRYWVSSMQAASISYRTYGLDLWGFGDTAHDPDRYPLDQQVTLLERFLLEMGIPRVALISHGLGALVAMLFAKRLPESVDRMMVVDCPADGKAIHNRLRISSPPDLVDWLLEKNPLAEPVRVDAPKADPQAIAVSLNNLDGLNLFQVMDGLSIPCLLVYGQNDPAVMAPDSSQLASLPMNVHQIALENSGHFPMLDESPKFNRLITDFLALDSGASPRELQLKEEWRRRVR